MSCRFDNSLHVRCLVVLAALLACGSGCSVKKTHTSGQVNGGFASPSASASTGATASATGEASVASDTSVTSPLQPEIDADVAKVQQAVSEAGLKLCWTQKFSGLLEADDETSAGVAVPPCPPFQSDVRDGFQIYVYTDPSVQATQASALERQPGTVAVFTLGPLNVGVFQDDAHATGVPDKLVAAIATTGATRLPS